MNNSVVLYGLIGVLILFVVVGNYAGRRVKNVEDYYVSGRNAGVLLIAGTVVASSMSTSAYLGDAGFVYEGYFAIDVLFTFIMSSGFVLGALFFGRFLRRSEALTVADYFAMRFNSNRMRAIVAVVAIVVCMCYMITVTQGINLIFSEVTGIDYKACLVITWVVYTSFTVYSGSRGVVITDTLMFLLFTAVGISIFPFIVNEAVGEFNIAEVFRQLATFEARPDIVSYHSMLTDDWLSTPLQAVVWAIILGIGWSGAIMVSPWQAGRHLMAKNEHTVLKAGVLICFIYPIVEPIVYFSAVTMNLINPDIEPIENVLIWAGYNILPTWLCVLLLAGIISAGLSSASTFLSIIGFSVVKDIMGKDAEEKDSLKLNRSVMLIAGIIVLVITFFIPLNIYWIMMFAATTVTASLGVASIMSIWNKKFTEKAAFWSIVSGFSITIILKSMENLGAFTAPGWLDLYFIGMIGSLIVAIAVTAKTTVTDYEKEYRQKLLTTPVAERSFAEAQKTIRAGYILMVLGVLVAAVLIMVWAVPYNSAF